MRIWYRRRISDVHIRLQTMMPLRPDQLMSGQNTALVKLGIKFAIGANGIFGISEKANFDNPLKVHAHNDAVVTPNLELGLLSARCDGI